MNYLVPSDLGDDFVPDFKGSNDDDIIATNLMAINVWNNVSITFMGPFRVEVI